jgi:hypothetical protein
MGDFWVLKSTLAIAIATLALISASNATVTDIHWVNVAGDARGVAGSVENTLFTLGRQRAIGGL